MQEKKARISPRINESTYKKMKIRCIEIGKDMEEFVEIAIREKLEKENKNGK